MDMDQSWIHIQNRCSAKYIQGVKNFMVVAREHEHSTNRTRCPCCSCNNVLLQHLDDVEEHLFVFGFDRLYTVWVHHGEKELINMDDDDYCDIVDDEVEEVDTMQDRLEDIYGGRYVKNYSREAFDSHGKYVPQGETCSSYDSHFDEESNKFVRLLREMERKLYPGCNLSTLSFLIKLLHVKVHNSWSNKSFDMLLVILKDAFSDGETLPKSHYEPRKVMRDLGLGYSSIDACINDCVLFRKDFEKNEHCPVCGESRYKFNQCKGKKKIPQKVLWYFPLKLRLQRLFMSRKTAIDMRWHKEKHFNDDNVLSHPADSEVWMDFDKQHDWFAKDSRNVRLALTTEGFNPFGDMSNAYSMWPVILIPYNLPSWKCMKETYFMMSIKNYYSS